MSERLGGGFGNIRLVDFFRIHNKYLVHRPGPLWSSTIRLRLTAAWIVTSATTSIAVRQDGCRQHLAYIDGVFYANCYSDDSDSPCDFMH